MLLGPKHSLCFSNIEIKLQLIVHRSYYSGKTYLFRISNVGISLSFNFRIQGHEMKVVEIEGSHTIQNTYDSLDVHVGQSIAVLVTLNQPPKDYYIVATSRFTGTVLTATAALHYSNSKSPVSGSIPAPPSNDYRWSMLQARTFRWTLFCFLSRLFGSLEREFKRQSMNLI